MYYFTSGCLGLISGLVFYFIALHHVEVRSEYDNGTKLKMLKDKKYIFVWMFASAVLFLIIAKMHFDYWQMFRVCLFTMLALNVSAVDILLRRIPNSVLLGMIVLHIANIAVTSGKGVDVVESCMHSMVGMVLAYLVFVLPSICGLRVGGGDIKYGAVIGFMLGFYGYIEAMAIMAASVLVYYAYLKITKTGNIKTAAPMAPFLSIGAFIALLFPVFG